MNQFNLNDLFTPNHRTEKYALTGFGTNGIVYGKPVNAADGAIVPFHQSEIIPWASRPKAAKGARLCPRGTEIQTLIFSKDNFTQDQAKDWAWEHDFNAGVDEKENTYRLRQQHPSKFKDGTFRTIDITDGIKAVIGCPIAKAGTGAYWIAIKGPEKIAKNGAQIVNGAEISIEKDIDGIRVDYSRTVDGNQIEFDGTLAKYRTGRSEEHTFKPGWFLNKASEAYYDENWEQVEDEILQAYNSPTAARGSKLAYVRNDILKKKQNVPVGDEYYGESKPLEYKWEDDDFYVKHNGKWKLAESIDWEFPTASRGGEIESSLKAGDTFVVSIDYQTPGGNPGTKRITVVVDDPENYLDEQDIISEAHRRFKEKKKGYSIVGGDIVKQQASRGGRIITFSDGYRFRVVSEDYAKKNWEKESIYLIHEDEESESLVQSEDDIREGETYGKEIGVKAARGIRLVNEDEYRARLRTLIDELTDIGIDLDGEEETIVAGLRLELEDAIDKEQDLSELKKMVSYIILEYTESWEEDLPKKERNLIAGSIAKFQTGKAARGAKTPQAMGKDRKYTSDQPHEKRYKLKRKSRVLRYKKS